MRYLTRIIALTSLLLTPIWPDQANGDKYLPSDDQLVIQNVTIISPERENPRQNMTVSIKRGRITAILKASDSVASKAKVIDGRGLFLTPGLMDSHAHITHVPGFDYTNSPLEQEHQALVDAYHEQQPRSLLYHGVTQVLDPSPKPGWQRFTDAPLHPDLFRCGVLPNLGAYPQIPIEAAVKAFPNFIIDPESGYNMIEGLDIDPNRHTPDASMRAIKESGAVCAKIFIEDGFGSLAHWRIPMDKLVGEIKAAADAVGIKLYAHANAVDMVRIALRNNIDILGHGMWNWQWPEGKGPVPLQETVDTIKTQKTGYIATFGVIDGLRGLTAPNPLIDPRLRAVTPQALLNWYQSDEAQWFKRELIADFGPTATAADVHQAFNGMLGRGGRVLTYLNEIDHNNIALGSDYPGSPSYTKQPGLSTLQEMEMMAGAGYPPRKVLEAATINNARLFGIERDYGSVEVGKIANLLLLKDNPLEDINAWDTIDTVILRGQPIKRGDLRANKLSP